MDNVIDLHSKNVQRCLDKADWGASALITLIERDDGHIEVLSDARGKSEVMGMLYRALALYRDE